MTSGSTYGSLIRSHSRVNTWDDLEATSWATHGNDVESPEGSLRVSIESDTVAGGPQLFPPAG